MMYVHAYQSYVWNHMVSIRLQKFGLQPIVGDLIVISNTSESSKKEVEEEEETDDLEPEQYFHSSTEVKVLTQSDLDSKKYTIFDVVLPLPGYDVKYPENDMKECYRYDMAYRIH
jgi:tRNA pseudouridine13 synthase